MKPDVEDLLVANKTSDTSAIMTTEMQLTILTVDYLPHFSSFFAAADQFETEYSSAFICAPRSLATEIVLIVTVSVISKIESRRSVSADSRLIGVHPSATTLTNPMIGQTPGPLGSGTTAEASAYCDEVHSIEHPVARFAYCGSRKHHHQRPGRTCSRR